MPKSYPGTEIRGIGWPITRSIVPTIAFIRWRKALQRDAAWRVAAPEQARMRRLVMIEIHLAAPLPQLDLPELDGDRLQLSDDRRSIVVTSGRPTHTLVELVKWIDQKSLELSDIQLKRPTLEDVFIELTGKKLRE